MGTYPLPPPLPVSCCMLVARRRALTLLVGRSSWTFPPGPISVSYTFNDDLTNAVHRETFDTVLLAVGRQANIADLHLDKTVSDRH